MHDNVATLRSRWTPETTAAAIAFLQGRETEYSFPLLELYGEMYIDLRGIKIHQVQLDGAVIRRVNLRWATFSDVGLKDTQLLQCNVSHVNFDQCYLRRTVFTQCDLVNAKFEACDCSSALLDACSLDFATFKNSEIRLENVHFRPDANPSRLVTVCRNLKLNAMAMGHFADAGELAFKEKSFEREALFRKAFATDPLPLAERTQAIGNWLSSALLSGLWGYGEKPGRLVWGIIANIFLFGTLQYWFDGLPDKPWWEHVYFSGITFLTIGYGDLAPVGMIPRFLALVEGAAGISILGLLIASATKKIMYR